MDKIAVFAMSDENKKEVMNYLKSHKDGKIDIIDFSESDDIKKKVTKAKIEANKSVVVFDAAEGMNRPFSETVAKLHEKNIKPILVIINSDPVNVGDAEMSAAEIVAEIDPEAQPWDLNFKTLFFSADKGFANTPAFERRGMDALIEAIQ
jgi:predicted membrane GTPase involved in stress response